jgi:hypothetical protein
MKICLEIDLGNAAFDDGAAPHEVARILARLAHRMEESGMLAHDGMPLYDINGNSCGVVSHKGL